MVSKSLDINTGHLLPFEPNTRCLLLELSADTLSVILWDKQRQLPEAVEMFAGCSSDDEDWAQMLQQSRLLNFTELETQLVHTFPRMIPTPSNLYQSQAIAGHMQMMFGKGQHQWFTSGDVLGEQQMVLAWQMPAVWRQRLTMHFSVLQSSHLVSALLKQATPAQGAHGHLVIYASMAWVVLRQNTQLLVATSVDIQPVENMVYDLLNICQQFQIAPDKVLWNVSGMVTRNSNLWQIIDRYFGEMQWMPSAVATPQELPSHYFAHLFSTVS